MLSGREGKLKDDTMGQESPELSEEDLSAGPAHAAGLPILALPGSPNTAREHNRAHLCRELCQACYMHHNKALRFGSAASCRRWRD